MIQLTAALPSLAAITVAPVSVTSASGGDFARSFTAMLGGTADEASVTTVAAGLQPIAAGGSGLPAVDGTSNDPLLQIMLADQAAPLHAGIAPKAPAVTAAVAPQVAMLTPAVAALTTTAPDVVLPAVATLTGTITALPSRDRAEVDARTPSPLADPSLLVGHAPAADVLVLPAANEITPSAAGAPATSGEDAAGASLPVGRAPAAAASAMPATDEISPSAADAPATSGEHPFVPPMVAQAPGDVVPAVSTPPSAALPTRDGTDVDARAPSAPAGPRLRVEGASAAAALVIPAANEISPSAAGAPAIRGEHAATPAVVAQAPGEIVAAVPARPSVVLPMAKADGAEAPAAAGRSLVQRTPVTSHAAPVSPPAAALQSVDRDPTRTAEGAAVPVELADPNETPAALPLRQEVMVSDEPPAGSSADLAPSERPLDATVARAGPALAKHAAASGAYPVEENSPLVPPAVMAAVPDTPDRVEADGGVDAETLAESDKAEAEPIIALAAPVSLLALPFAPLTAPILADVAPAGGHAAAVTPEVRSLGGAARPPVAMPVPSAADNVAPSAPASGSSDPALVPAPDDTAANFATTAAIASPAPVAASGLVTVPVSAASEGRPAIRPVPLASGDVPVLGQRPADPVVTIGAATPVQQPVAVKPTAPGRVTPTATATPAATVPGPVRPTATAAPAATVPGPVTPTTAATSTATAHRTARAIELQSVAPASKAFDPAVVGSKPALRTAPAAPAMEIALAATPMRQITPAGVTSPAPSTRAAVPAETPAPVVSIVEPAQAALTAQRQVNVPLAGITAPAAQVFAAAMRAAAQTDRAAPARDVGVERAPLDLTGASLAASGLAGAQPVVAAVVDSRSTPLDLRGDSWPGAMIAHIERLRDAADAADATIRVVPDALGSIDVSVRRSGDQVHVQFAAEQAATRQILQDAQPRLAELAEARGLRLGGTAVENGPATGSFGGGFGGGGFGSQPGGDADSTRQFLARRNAAPLTPTASADDALAPELTRIA